MINIRHFIALVISLAIGACGGYPTGEQTSVELRTDGKNFTLPDIGRNAAVVLAGDIHVQDLLRQSKTEEAIRALESTYLYQISLLREFDRDLAHDERHVRLRNSVVLKLKRLWLENPPEFLDSASAAYIETTCSRIPGCPPGKLRGRKALPAEKQ